MRADVHVDTRIIAATNRNLEQAVKDGAFREDLYYRLNVVTITLPPLRDRIDALPLLVEHFPRKVQRAVQEGAFGSCRRRTMNLLMQYRWPGNVRELENMGQAHGGAGQRANRPAGAHRRRSRPRRPEPEDGFLDLSELDSDLASGKGMALKVISKRASQIAEKRVIERVLHQTRWNRKEAAERLQISYKALLYKMKENGLSEGR